MQGLPSLVFVMGPLEAGRLRALTSLPALLSPRIAVAGS